MTATPEPAAQQLHQPLGAVMDARAHNLHQSVLIYDPSPAEDSLMECIAGLLHCHDERRPQLVAEALTLLRKLAASNVAEGDCELSAAGILDALTKAMHMQGVRSAMTVKAAARQLRAALQVLDGHPDGVAFFRASSQIREVIDTLPFEVLYGPGLRNELGSLRHRQLQALVGQPEQGVGVAA